VSVSESRAPLVKPFTDGMRSPVVAPMTRFLIGLPLVVLTTRTDTYFAWTIDPPITAAFLGANYWASALLALLASRETVWARGRISVSVALVFAPLTTAATLIHIDKFHLDTFFGWFWVVAYAVYPPMLGLLFVRQLRTPGGDPPRTTPLAGWVRATLGSHAAILMPLGAALFIAPSTVGGIWPWTLTPLTGRVVAAWLLALGLLGAHAIWENDVSRAKVALLAYPFLGAMHVAAVARFPDEMQWGEAGAYVYLVLVASTFALGIYGWLSLHRMTPEGDPARADG
jgi:hypothetical protein